MRLNFISYKELVNDTRALASKLKPHDLVVAIPRSGLIPGCIISELWGKPLTTPDMVAKDKPEVLSYGRRLQGGLPSIGSILVIDDSFNHGNELDKCKEKLKSVPKGIHITYAAVYGRKNDKGCLCYKLVPQPRQFEWNWLHHESIEATCFDMDGVLCVKPTHMENDYGDNYEVFLKFTKPKFIPQVAIPAIITGRLEKYRPQTEAWLDKHNVNYKELIMRKDPGTPHAEHKANHLKLDRLKHCKFVEDEPAQAKAIANLADRPVICVSEMKVYNKEVN